MLKGIQLADRISIPSQRHLTDAGQMIVPCAFARTGSQLYTAGQIGLVDKDPKEVITVWRDEADVFDETSMKSFRSSPVTLGHPKDADGKSIAVNAENAKELQVGMLEGIPSRDEDLLTGTLVLSVRDAINALEEGTQELSAGYTCDIEEVDGKFFQRNIVANHIAIVAKGRAGSSCRISDEADAVIEDMEEAEKATIHSSLGTDTSDALEAPELHAKILLRHVTDAVSAADAKVVAAEKALADAEEATVKLTEDHKEAISGLEIKLEDAIKINEEAVVERCEVIDKARLIADMSGFGDKSISDIKKAVLAAQMPSLNLDGKDDSYIAARFDILVEDSQHETPMAKVLRDAQNSTSVEPKKDPVVAARNKMIARNKAK